MSFNSIQSEFEAAGQPKIVTCLEQSAALDLFGLSFAPVNLVAAHAMPVDDPSNVYPFSVRLPPGGRAVTFASQWGGADRQQSGAHPGGVRAHVYALKLFVAVAPRAESLQSSMLKTLPWAEAVDRLYSGNRTIDGTCHQCWLTGGDWAEISYADGEWVGWLWDLFIEQRYIMMAR